MATVMATEKSLATEMATDFFFCCKKNMFVCLCMFWHCVSFAMRANARFENQPAFTGNNVAPTRYATSPVNTADFRNTWGIVVGVTTPQQHALYVVLIN